MKTKNKIQLAIMSFLGVSVCLVAFLAAPIFNDIHKASSQLQTKEKRISSMEGKIRNLEEFQKNFSQIKKNLDKAEKLFIDSKAPTGFISFLETAAKESQLEIKISPSAPEEREGEDWPYISFRIASISAFPNFYRFLEKIESSPYLIKVNSLRISRFAEGSSEFSNKNFSVGDVGANLEIRVFCDTQYAQDQEN